jgi:hypothetical protein
MQYTSMGHCLTYGVYTFIEYASGYIVSTDLLDRRETRGSSPKLELYGFLRALYLLVAAGLDISDVVTDEHKSIVKFFSK